MADQDPKKIEIKIEIDKEIAEGIYSNLAIINHSHAEFVIDFIKLLPGLDVAKVKSRIILTPSHAKSLMFALEENIKKYEAVHGKILNQGNPPSPNNFFGSTNVNFN